MVFACISDIQSNYIIHNFGYPKKLDPIRNRTDLDLDNLKIFGFAFYNIGSKPDPLPSPHHSGTLSIGSKFNSTFLYLYLSLYYIYYYRTIQSSYWIVHTEYVNKIETFKNLKYRGTNYSLIHLNKEYDDVLRFLFKIQL